MENEIVEEIVKTCTIDELNVLKSNGNTLFAQQNFVEAESVYQDALLKLEHVSDDTTPESVLTLKIVLKSNLSACYLKISSFESALRECTEVLELDPNHVKCLLRRAKANEFLEKYDKCILDLKKVVELDVGNKDAKESLERITPIEEKKRKEEMDKMMGQLKDLGNQFLGMFGMSTDNFQMNQNEGGGYSVNIKK